MSERDGTASLLIRSQKRLRPTTAQIYFIKERAGLRILVFVAASQISAAGAYQIFNITVSNSVWRDVRRRSEKWA